ncbi:MAG: NUDIX hydrolase [Candidatus Bathyarchaeia archaeon]
MVGKFDAVKVLSSKVVYDMHGSTIVEDTLEFADGSTFKYVYFKSCGTVAVAAFTEDNKMILTRQYRHPLGKVVYDIPGGAIEAGETPLQAALRELEEETGYTAEKLEWIGRFSRGPSSQAITEIFFGRAKRKGTFDAKEIVQIKLMDFNQLVEKILEGECFDAALVAAALIIKAKKIL